MGPVLGLFRLLSLTEMLVFGLPVLVVIGLWRVVLVVGKIGVLVGTVFVVAVLLGWVAER